MTLVRRAYVGIRASITPRPKSAVSPLSLKQPGSNRRRDLRDEPRIDEEGPNLMLSWNAASPTAALGDGPPPRLAVAQRVSEADSAMHVASLAGDPSARTEAESVEAKTSRHLAKALNDAYETNTRLKLITDAVLDGVVTLDKRNAIVSMNKSAERIFGFRTPEITGKNARLLLADASEIGTVERYLHTGEQGIIGERLERECRRKDNTTFPAEFTLSEVGDADGYFIAIVRDISEKKRMERVERHHRDTLEIMVQQRTHELEARTQQLDEARLETLKKLARAAEYRDDQTFKHAQRVGELAMLLGEGLGLTPRELATIRQAAPLHDIGKLAVSDAILQKPSELTPAEWRQMRRHTTVGHEILFSDASGVLSMASEIALTHHERWDGSGYPAGLRGPRIPLSGRIVALADVFDSLCNARPYKKSWSTAEAVNEIRRLEGSQFDPDVVAAFNHLDPIVVAGLRDTGAQSAV